MELARRRGGGGAVYLGPGEQLWLDVWVPRDDPLWVRRRVRRRRVGRGVVDGGAGAASGSTASTSTAGARCRARSGDLVCFAGRGPGEVFHGGRKVVGLSQWRAREGALFSSCAYLRWDPAPLLALRRRRGGRRAPVWPATWRRWRPVWPSSNRRRSTLGRRRRCWTRCLGSGDAELPGDAAVGVTAPSG